MRYFKKRIDKPLGELLIEKGLISRTQLQEALKVQKERGGLIGEVMVSLGFAKEEDIAHILSLQYGFPYLPLEHYEIPKELVKIIPKQVASQYCLIPIDKIGSTLTIAMANPLNPQAIDDVEYISNSDVQIFVATASDIRKAIERCYAENP
ncbi:MAG: hypothetical protein DRP80_01810 [Candidatus Omnitrophota bacterium]|nr:MAG: hypothetical protein DRP69_03705 [Candidatus Omnitrophota bacterium]RKY44560.1 MAG: hypothetical protein DRP80_01810 [Candidatus Omnitrophota bacterium]